MIGQTYIQTHRDYNSIYTTIHSLIIFLQYFLPPFLNMFLSLLLFLSGLNLTSPKPAREKVSRIFFTMRNTNFSEDPSHRHKLFILRIWGSSDSSLIFKSIFFQYSLMEGIMFKILFV